MLSAELQKADDGHNVPFSYTNTIVRIFDACCAADGTSFKDANEVDRKHLVR